MLAILRARDLARAPYIVGLARGYKYLTDLGIEIDDALWDRMIDREVAEHGAPEPVRPERFTSEPERATVYYLKVGRFIKIGQTYDWNSRRRAYPPDVVLLATEEGERNALEWQRLFQFADDLAHGREWFRPSDALLQHVDSLRTEPLSLADLDFGD